MDNMLLNLLIITILKSTHNMNSQLIKKNMRHIKKYCTTVGMVCKVPIVAKIYCYGLLMSTIFGAGLGFREGLYKKNDINILDGAYIGCMVWLLIPIYVTMNTYYCVKSFKE